MFRGSLNPIVVVDENRIIREANDAALALFGVTREELVEAPAEPRIATRERASGVLVWERLLRTGEVSGRRTFVHSDGRPVPVSHRSRLVRIEGQAYVVTVMHHSAGPEVRPPSVERGPTVLSEREREVVALIAVGRHTEEIGEELHIASATVRSHVGNAMERLGVHTRAHLVWVAVQAGLLVPTADRAAAGKASNGAEEGTLSQREREVLALIAVGRRTGEVARKLRISPATVRSHVRNAMEKLAVHTRAHLVWVALGEGLIDPPVAAHAPAGHTRSGA